MVGKTLGHYEILEPLGKGGMGEVYRARDTKLKREVAIKVLPEDLAADEERLRRLEREAYLLASVNHPNIATIHNLEESGGARWLVLELVDGEGLDRRLGRGSVPLEESLRIGRQVAAALEAAHEKGIVHRDLKPANVMVDAKGTVKVLDFGIAKATTLDEGQASRDRGEKWLASSIDTLAADNMAAHLTAPGMLVGTAPYMSPEQVRGHALDKRSDIWSFGCLMFELLTGRRPFDCATLADTLSAILEHDPEWDSLPRETPASISALIRRCLQKDADLRVHDIADARIEIDEVLATAPDRRLTNEELIAAQRARPAGAAVIAGAARSLATGLAVVTAAAVIAVALWLGLSDRFSGAPASGVDPSSIAVLPFANIGGDPANEAIVDGLAETLRNTLAKIRGVSVTARTSSFQFKDRPEEITEIGRQLKVATLLEGSAQKAGEKVRITVRLVDASSGATRWSDSYDRNYQAEEIFSLFEDIATRIAGELEVELLGDDVVRLAQRPTDNTQAFEAYLRGNQFLARYTNEAFRAGARNFQQAIDLDPDYAMAYVGLADAYMLQSRNRYGKMPVQDALDIAEPAIARALELDDQLGEAHAMFGFARELQRDVDGALASYQRAIELSPKYSRAYQLYYWRLFLREGDSDRTRALAARALELDPRSPAQNENYGWSLFEVGRFDEALVYFRRTAEYEPSYPFAYNALGIYERAFGDFDQAIELYERAVNLSPETGMFRKSFGESYAAIGRAAEATAEFVAWLELFPDLAVPYRKIGDVHWEVLGRPREAIDWYRQAVDADPESPLFQARLVLLYLDLDDPASAKRWADQVTATYPDRVSSRIAKLTLEMYGSRYAEGRALARELAETARFGGYLSQFDQPYSEYAPVGYFGLLAGDPSSARAFPERAYPELLDADPVINRYTINAAIDLAAALMASGERTRADLLLAKSLAFIESEPDDLRRVRYREQPAEIYALQGRVPEALAALRSAIDQGWRRGWWRLRHKPHYESLRDEPQFQTMLTELEAEAERLR